MNIFVTIECPGRSSEHFLYSDINAELNNVVRHEVEHITQQNTSNRIAGRALPISTKERKKAEGTKDYFLSRDEIPVLIAGFYRNAKYRKLPIDIVAKEFLDSFTGADEMMNKRDEKEVMRVLMNYAKENYPKAIFSKNW